MAAGRGAPASMRFRRWNSAVGAFPIATTAPSSLAPHSSRAARRASVVDGRRQHGNPRIAEGADDVVTGGQTLARDAGSHHLSVAENRRAVAQSCARSRDDTGCEGDVVDEIDLATCMNHAHYSLRDIRRETAQVGFGPNGGKGLAIDFRAVTDVLDHVPHDRGITDRPDSPGNRHPSQSHPLRPRGDVRSCGRTRPSAGARRQAVLPARRR